MEWEYKDINISVNSEGFFVFSVNQENYLKPTLKEAKCKIDKLLQDYYNFTQEDMNKLMSKLDKREQEVVRSLYREINAHANNAYCSLGIVDDDWHWGWDFNK